MTQPEILYEDAQLIVCYKPAGIATQTKKLGQKDMVSILSNHIAQEGTGQPFIGVVHRLDQPVEGVMVFAKTKQAAMIRNVLVSPCINDISTSLAGADHGMFAAEAEKAFATNLNLFGNEVDFTFMMMYSIGAILIFLVLNLISYKFSSKRKD